jgi:sugar lactone lactonase YvrE/enterochelin esterase-like enzyme
MAAFAQEPYALGPDSQKQPGVPEGKVTQHTWNTSKVYPGSTRDYWVYVPAQYKPGTPAAVMVFQDGGGFVATGEKARWRAPVVFNNLIHKGEMPVTIGIFINPGVLPAANANAMGRYNRSYEYDAVNDNYARFLIDEILPEVGKQYTLTNDPNLRGIAGSSSGGICAFTAAWQRPDAFRRVLSFIGSYTDLRGGHYYPELVRKTEPKPIRVFQQDGNRDQNIYAGNWWIANQELASALEFAGYDHTFVTGTEGHNSIHGSAILPEALRWLWREWSKPITASHTSPKSQRHIVADIVTPGQDWQLVSKGHRFTEGPAVDKHGNVYFTDIPNNRIHKIALDRSVSVFKEDTGGANGLMFGPDGRLYVCQNGRKRIVAYTPDGTESVIAEGLDSNDLVVNAKGELWVTDPPNKRIWFIDAKGNKRVVMEKGLEFPNGVILSPDQTLLMAVDMRGRWVWSWQVQEDGSLLDGQPFFRLETWDTDSQSAGDGMTVDSDGFLYVTTRLGVQILDQAGRVNAILNKPNPGWLANVVFGGPNLDTLYVTAGESVYKRQLRRKGVWPWQPVKPPQPRL